MKLWGLSSLLEEPLVNYTIGALALGHLAMASLAASDCCHYPFNHENSLRLLYWKPAQFTAKMLYPLMTAIRLLWVFSVVVLWTGDGGGVGLLLATGFFKFAFLGHTSPRWTIPGEVFLQQISVVLLIVAFLAASQVSLKCSTPDLTKCLIVTQNDTLPLIPMGGRTRTGLRF